jgi:ATP-dependent DNA ligase
MHPKTEVKPMRESVEKILAAGWAGQTKIHGHRAQVHLHADPSMEPIVYNRQGRPHKKLLPPEIANELRRILELERDWTVIDGEWLKPEGKMFIFDILKENGKSLRPLTYADRYERLPKSYISPHVKTLPLLTTSAKCLEVLESSEAHVEGLVFKALTAKGFDDTSIVRCRKRR